MIARDIVHQNILFVDIKGYLYMEVEPIRDVKKIIAMRKILRAGRYGPRDEAMFVVGINTALRIGDLLALAVGDVQDSDGKLSHDVEIKEKKTGKPKRFPLNKLIRETLQCYLKAYVDTNQFSPLFPSRQGGKAISRWQARKILSEAGESVGLSHIGTHSLRKTFGYHVYQRTGGNLGLVQKLLNHSTSAVTLRYIGIDQEQMDNTYLELNLGA
jgi:integrase